MVFKKWVYFFLIGIIVNLSICAGFNYFINPTGVFSAKDIEKVNKIRNYPLRDDKIAKFYYCRRANPNVLMMGNSTMGALNPKDLKKYASGNIYNMSMHGASLWEEYYYVKYFIENYDIRTIVMGIDLASFNYNKELTESYGFSTNRLKEFYIWDYFDSLFSLDATMNSYKTLKENMSGHALSKLDLYTGMDTWKSSYAALESEGSGHVNKAINEFLKDITSAHPTGVFGNKNLQDPHQIDEGLGYFKKIVDLCKKNGIDLKVYITPTHAVYTDALYARNLGDTFEYLKRQAVDLTPLYDFSGRNTITEDLTWYWDPLHIQQKAGPLVFARIFNDQSVPVPGDFGILLIKNNIDEHILKQRKQTKEIKWTNQE